MELDIEKLYVNTKALVEEAEKYQGTTEQTNSLKETRAANTVVGDIYETISGLKAAANEGELEAKENAKSAEENSEATDGVIKQIKAIVEEIRELIANFEADLAEAISDEIGLHMAEIIVLVEDLMLYAEDYYDMSFLNEISDLTTKAA
jgi:predicted S18 family serine protease